MPQTVKVRRFGGSLGMLFPGDIVRNLALDEGDELFITNTEEGLSLSAYDPEFDAAMQDAREFMRKRRNAYRELAK